jgi:hypothetical protein
MWVATLFLSWFFSSQTSLSSLCPDPREYISRIQSQSFIGGYFPSALRDANHPTRWNSTPKEWSVAIQYSSSNKYLTRLSCPATAGPPHFSVLGPATQGPFVVAAVDLDAPTPQAPTSAQIRHFLGGNFIRSPSKSLLLSNTTPAISEFRQPTPPAGSDPHRSVTACYLRGEKKIDKP